MPQWLALALLLAGTATQYAQSKNVQQHQLAALNRGERNSRQSRERGMAEIMKNVEEFDPRKRTQRLDAEQAKSQENLTTALQQSVADRTAAGAVSPAQGKQSQTFLTTKARAEAQTAREGLDLARLLSKFGGHSKFRQDESLRRADAASRAGVEMDSARAWALSGQRAASRISPNLAVMLLSSLAQGVGAGGLSAPAGAAAGAGSLALKPGTGPNSAGPLHAIYGGPL